MTLSGVQTEISQPKHTKQNSLLLWELVGPREAQLNLFRFNSNLSLNRDSKPNQQTTTTPKIVQA